MKEIAEHVHEPKLRIQYRGLLPVTKPFSPWELGIFLLRFPIKRRKHFSRTYKNINDYQWFELILNYKSRLKEIAEHMHGHINMYVRIPFMKPELRIQWKFKFYWYQCYSTRSFFSRACSLPKNICIKWRKHCRWNIMEWCAILFAFEVFKVLG